MIRFDVNCDMGEGGGFDNQLMALISTCNIACGGHYGNTATIDQTVELAMNKGVKMGAHPAYPDKDNFGRKTVSMTGAPLKKALKRQIIALKNSVEKRQGQLHHVKPHGALYHDMGKDKVKAQAVIDAVLEVNPALILFTPPKSGMQKWAKGKLKMWTEAFADRNYKPDFSLVSRGESHAVLTQKEAVLARVYKVASQGEIQTAEGVILQADFDTICLHSDTENAVEILKYVKKGLRNKNIEIA